MSTLQLVRASGLTAAALMFGLLLGLLLVRGSSGAIGPDVASANWSGNRCDTSVFSQCVANNNLHQVYLVPALSANMKSVTRWAITNLNAVRDITAIEVTTQADVIVSEGNFSSTNYIAWTACASGATYGTYHGEGFCYPQNLKYNTGKYPSEYNGERDKVIACHELGHTVGLRHTTSGDDPNDWDISCMRDFDFGQRPNILRGYTSHDQSHINAEY